MTIPAGLAADSAIQMQQLPRDVQLLAGALSRKHGNIVVAREKSGLHLYMACPSCLQKDGRPEMRKRHLALNVSKYFGQDNFLTRRGGYDNQRCCQCMKEDKPYRVQELLDMAPLSERGIPDEASSVTISSVERKCLIRDAAGNEIPDHPGLVVPVNQLPGDHPAVIYLKSRNFDLNRLYQQFRASFCYQEAPEDADKGRFYRRLPCGFRDTPQGRIIFYADMLGVQQSWQARIMEMVHEDIKYFFHPYQNVWTAMEHKVEGKWQPLPHAMQEGKKWDPQKYKNAFSSQRNEVVFGYDAALRWNADMPKKLVISAEGPPDAARFGPPGIPLTGKYLSATQRRLITSNFHAMIAALQNDKASRELAATLSIAMQGNMQYFAVVTPPDGIKDFGEMDDASARAHVLKSIMNAPAWVLEAFRRI